MSKLESSNSAAQRSPQFVRASGKDVGSLHVMQILGDPVGGIRKHVHELIRGLSSAGVISSYAYGLNPDASFACEIDAVRECTVGSVTYNVRKRPHLSDWGNVRRLVAYVRRRGVAVVHGHGAKGGAYARLVSRLCGVKSVYTPHGGSVHSMFSPSENSVYRIAERVLLPFTDALLFESNYSAEAYSAIVGRRSRRFLVNHHGIAVPNVEMVAMRARELGYRARFPNLVHIGMFGTLRFQKGQEFGIRAVTELVRDGVGVMIHLFGDGPDRDSLQQLASSLGVEDRVVFHGHVKDPEAHMYCMDIILVPSRFESFGYVALEAMSLKRVVIAANVGGLREIVDNARTGLLVDARSIRELRDAILFCVTNERARVQLAASGYQRFLDSFTFDRMLRTTCNMYYQLCGRPIPSCPDNALSVAGCSDDHASLDLSEPMWKHN
jgi:glycosyltransferase involved in cell wall biosynthesis